MSKLRSASNRLLDGVEHLLEEFLTLRTNILKGVELPSLQKDRQSSSALDDISRIIEEKCVVEGSKLED